MQCSFNNWARVGTVYSYIGCCGIWRIFRGGPRNLANYTAEFHKICCGKLWDL